MAKQAKAFNLPEEDRQVAASADQPSTQAENATAAKAPRPAYREGRKNLSVWLDAKAFNSFKAMVAEEGETMQNYLIKMINAEFAKKGRPTIAK